MAPLAIDNIDFTALLPDSYRDDAPREYRALIDRTISSLTQACALRDFYGVNHWIGVLERLRRFRAQFTIADRLALVNTLFALLFDESNELGPDLLGDVCNVIGVHLRKGPFLPIVIDWRPLWTLFCATAFPDPRRVNLGQTGALLDGLVFLVRRSRRYFDPVTAPAEILATARPLLCPFSGDFFIGLGAIHLFMPTKFSPQLQARFLAAGAPLPNAADLAATAKASETISPRTVAAPAVGVPRLVSPIADVDDVPAVALAFHKAMAPFLESLASELLGIWEWCSHKQVDYLVLSVLSRAACHNPFVDWASRIPVIFSHFLRVTSVPLTLSDAVATSSTGQTLGVGGGTAGADVTALAAQGPSRTNSAFVAVPAGAEAFWSDTGSTTCSRSASVAALAVAAIRPTVGDATDPATDALLRLLSLLRPFFHPGAAMGSWSLSISQFVASLCDSLSGRLGGRVEPTYAHVTLQRGRVLPAPLADAQIALIWAAVQPMLVSALYSRDSKMRAAGRLGFFAMSSVAPGLTHAPVMAVCRAGLRTLSKTHQTTAALELLEFYVHQLVSRSPADVVCADAARWEPLRTAGEAMLVDGDGNPLAPVDEGPGATTDGAEYLYELLMLTAPGIDANDPRKTHMTLAVYASLLGHLPLFSSHTAGRTRGDRQSANGERAAAALCGQIGDWALLVLERLLAVFEHVGILSDEDSATSDTTLSALVGEVSTSLFENMDDAIFERALAVIRPAIHHAVVSEGRRETLSLIGAAAHARPSTVLAEVIPSVLQGLFGPAAETVLALGRDAAPCPIELPESPSDPVPESVKLTPHAAIEALGVPELLWHVGLLSTCVECIGSAPLEHRDAFLGIVRVLAEAVDVLPEAVVKGPLSEVVRFTVVSLADTYPLETRPRCPAIWHHAAYRRAHARTWGLPPASDVLTALGPVASDIPRLSRDERLRPVWHIPTEPELRMAADLLAALSRPLAGILPHVAGLGDKKVTTAPATPSPTADADAEMAGNASTSPKEHEGKDKPVQLQHRLLLLLSYIEVAPLFWPTELPADYAVPTTGAPAEPTFSKDELPSGVKIDLPLLPTGHRPEAPFATPNPRIYLRTGLAGDPGIVQPFPPEETDCTAPLPASQPNLVSAQLASTHIPPSPAPSRSQSPDPEAVMAAAALAAEATPDLAESAPPAAKRRRISAEDAFSVSAPVEPAPAVSAAQLRDTVPPVVCGAIIPPAALSEIVTSRHLLSRDDCCRLLLRLLVALQRHTPDDVQGLLAVLRCISQVMFVPTGTSRSHAKDADAQHTSLLDSYVDWARRRRFRTRSQVVTEAYVIHLERCSWVSSAQALTPLRRTLVETVFQMSFSRYVDVRRDSQSILASSLALWPQLSPATYDSVITCAEVAVEAVVTHEAIPAAERDHRDVLLDHARLQGAFYMLLAPALQEHFMDSLEPLSRLLVLTSDAMRRINNDKMLDAINTVPYVCTVAYGPTQPVWYPPRSDALRGISQTCCRIFKPNDKAPVPIPSGPFGVHVFSHYGERPSTRCVPLTPEIIKQAAEVSLNKTQCERESLGELLEFLAGDIVSTKSGWKWVLFCSHMTQMLTHTGVPFPVDSAVAALRPLSEGNLQLRIEQIAVFTQLLTIVSTDLSRVPAPPVGEWREHSAADSAQPGFVHPCDSEEIFSSDFAASHPELAAQVDDEQRFRPWRRYRASESYYAPALAIGQLPMHAWTAYEPKLTDFGFSFGAFFTKEVEADLITRSLHPIEAHKAAGDATAGLEIASEAFESGPATAEVFRELLLAAATPLETGEDGQPRRRPMDAPTSGQLIEMLLAEAEDQLPAEMVRMLKGGVIMPVLEPNGQIVFVPGENGQPQEDSAMEGSDEPDTPLPADTGVSSSESDCPGDAHADAPDAPDAPDADAAEPSGTSEASVSDGMGADGPIEPEFSADGVFPSLLDWLSDSGGSSVMRLLTGGQDDDTGADNEEDKPFAPSQATFWHLALEVQPEILVPLTKRCTELIEASPVERGPQRVAAELWAGAMRCGERFGFLDVESAPFQAVMRLFEQAKSAQTLHTEAITDWADAIQFALLGTDYRRFKDLFVDQIIDDAVEAILGGYRNLPAAQCRRRLIFAYKALGTQPPRGVAMARRCLQAIVDAGEAAFAVPFKRLRYALANFILAASCCLVRPAARPAACGAGFASDPVIRDVLLTALASVRHWVEDEDGIQALPQTDALAVASAERCRTVAFVLDTVVSRLPDFVFDAVSELLPSLTALISHSDPDVCDAAAGVLQSLGALFFSHTSADGAYVHLEAMLESSMTLAAGPHAAKTWAGRSGALELVRSLALRHLFIMPPVRVLPCIESALLDQRAEVAQLASRCLAVIVRVIPESELQPLLQRLRKLCKRSNSPTQRLAGVLGLSSVTLAWPFTVPDFMPIVVARVAKLAADDDAAVRSAARATCAQWWTTHSDREEPLLRYFSHQHQELVRSAVMRSSQGSLYA
jgi:proteasome activator subunit 4